MRRERRQILSLSPIVLGGSLIPGSSATARSSGHNAFHSISHSSRREYRIQLSSVCFLICELLRRVKVKSSFCGV